MINRLGRAVSQPNPVSPQDDPIAKIIPKILRAKPPVTIREVRESGEIVFSIDLSPLGIKEADLKGSVFLRTVATSNFIGEFLLYQNFDRFLDLLMAANDYDQMVKKFQHLHFGVSRQGLVLILTFHVSRIYDLINTDLAKVIATITE